MAPCLRDPEKGGLGERVKEQEKLVHQYRAVDCLALLLTKTIHVTLPSCAQQTGIERKSSEHALSIVE